MKKIIFILAFQLLTISSINSQWVPTYGTTLSDKSINCLSSIGNNLFAGVSQGGVYKSTDNGVSWNLTGFSNISVHSLAVLGTNLIAATDIGVFRSTNNGGNWTATDLTYTAVYTLYANGTNIYAGHQIDILISTNNGVNWTIITNDLPHWPEVYAINEIGSYLFAGTRYGVFRSSNNGANWVSTSISMWVWSFTTSGTNIFAATHSGGIFRSTDNGVIWNNVNNGIPNLPVRILYANGYNIFAGTDSNLYRTTNNGGNWTTVNRGLTNLRVLSLIKIGSNIFAGCYRYPDEGGVHITTNNGDVWTLPDFGCQWANTLISKGTNIFASTGYDGVACNGVFLTTNYGNNWVSVNNGLTNLYVRSLVVCDSNIFAATYGDGVFILSNNGGNWTAVNNGLSNLYIRSLAVNGTNIYAGTDSAGVFRSNDSGGNWIAVNNGLSIRPIRCLGINDDNIFAGTDSGRVYLSTNNGGIWALINIGISNNHSINCFAFSGNYVYAGTYGGVYRTSNNGVNWTIINATFEIYSLATSGTNVVMGKWYGVHLSTNYGATWIVKNQGFSDNPTGLSLLIKDNYIFAGIGRFNYINLYYSVWRRLFSEFTDVKNINGEIPSSYSLYQNYPNPFNPSTSIRYNIQKNRFVKLVVYDILGKEIETIVNEKQSAGTYEVTFNAILYPSGVYFYRLQTDWYSDTKKMLLIR